MASSYSSSKDDGQLPRGIRNNNPGNIKDDGTSWQGQTGNDGLFVTFADMSWGTRALGRSLINMIKKGLDTPDQLIRTWSATDQDSYVANVSGALGIAPDDQISLDNATIAALMRAIITQENGIGFTGYVTDQDIQDGIAKINNSALSLVQAAATSITQDPSAGIAIVSGLIVLTIVLSSWLGRRK